MKLINGDLQMKNLITGIIVLSTFGCVQKKNDSATATTFKSTSCVANSSVTDGGRNSVESKIIQNISKNVILATYQGLATAAAKLHDQVLVLENSRTPENLEKTQSFWREGRKYWESTESFLFGPVESLSIDPQIDTWPLNVPVLEGILKTSTSITPEVIRSSGTDLKGFHTVEYLLFGNGKSTNVKPISAFTDRDIEYLKATTQVLAENTAALATAWTTQSDPDIPGSPSYISLITEPGTSNPLYSSNHAVIFEFLNGMIKIADEVGNGKIADPLGDTVDKANPAAEESPFSWNSVTDFSNNIRSIQLMYEGAESNNGLGLKTLLSARNQELAEEVSAQISQAIQKIEDISKDGQTFGRAILDSEGRKRVMDAQKELNALHSLLNGEVQTCFQQ
jgi:putative iron-regulated protein